MEFLFPFKEQKILIKFSKLLVTVLLEAVSSNSQCVDIPKEDSPVKTYRGNLFLIFGISQDFDVVFVVSQSGHTETFVSTPPP